MKKGISIWAFPNQEPRDCFRMAKRFGYDGIELSFDESGPISPQSAETELMEIRKAAGKSRTQPLQPGERLVLEYFSDGGGSRGKRTGRNSSSGNSWTRRLLLAATRS